MELTINFCPNCGNQRDKRADYCVKCGFKWSTIMNPDESLTGILCEELSSAELFYFMQFFYRISHNLVSYTANEAGVSMGHVQRILNGERSATAYFEKFAQVFKKKLKSVNAEKVM